MAKQERENIINWTEGDTTARLYVTSKKIKNRLAEYGVEPIEKDEESPFGNTYEVSRNWIRVQKPSGEGRVRTKAQKAAAIERLRLAREKRIAARKAAGKTKKTAEVEEEETTPTKTSKSGMKTVPSKATKAAPAADVEEEEEEVEVVKPKKKTA